MSALAFDGINSCDVVDSSRSAPKVFTCPGVRNKARSKSIAIVQRKEKRSYEIR